LSFKCVEGNSTVNKFFYLENDRLSWAQNHFSDNSQTKLSHMCLLTRSQVLQMPLIVVLKILVQCLLAVHTVIWVHCTFTAELVLINVQQITLFN